jgi:hypothetical protein
MLVLVACMWFARRSRSVLSGSPPRTRGGHATANGDAPPGRALPAGRGQTRVYCTRQCRWWPLPCPGPAVSCRPLLKTAPAEQDLHGLMMGSCVHALHSLQGPLRFVLCLCGLGVGRQLHAVLGGARRASTASTVAITTPPPLLICPVRRPFTQAHPRRSPECCPGPSLGSSLGLGCEL